MPDLTDKRTRPAPDLAPDLADGAEILAALRAAADERVLILDGAMGTQIQGLGFEEAQFRGTRFAGCDHHLRGNNDLLTLTQPEAIEEIHFDYAIAGADILETNTFSSTAIAQADYAMETAVYDLNREGAGSRGGCRPGERQDGRRRFVAGALGPTNRTASLSPDVNNPGYRAVTFDGLRDAYAEQARGLIDGGAEIILIETIFDTLNAKAAVFGVEMVFAEKGVRLPLMISFTITDKSGRTIRARRRPPSGIRCAMPGPSHRPQLRAGRRGGAGASGQRRCRGRRHLRLRLSMPGCPMNSASMTRRPRPWQPRSAASPRRGWSISSGAAAARRRSISAPSPRRSRACPRAPSPASRR
jgi:methionine synthase I (cobalamin-dependent)